MVWVSNAALRMAQELGLVERPLCPDNGQKISRREKGERVVGRRRNIRMLSQQQSWRVARHGLTPPRCPVKFSALG
jgi:hypothetical protein